VKDIINLSDNIKNAFDVVRKTYTNIEKLIKHCDYISNDCGYVSVTPKFLRWKSDTSCDGWLITDFIKLYQSQDDITLSNAWKNGPIYVIKINLMGAPTVYLSKFEYEDISSWNKGVSPADHWGYYRPIDTEYAGFNKTPIDGKDGYYITIPTEDTKTKYWNLKKCVYTNIDLIQINSSNVSEKIFDTFDTLKYL
jgi:hypothetical protein